MLSDFVEVEEEFEEEAEEEGEDERKEKKEPKKKVPLFKLQAKNSKNVSGETLKFSVGSIPGFYQTRTIFLGTKHQKSTFKFLLGRDIHMIF